MPQVLIDLENNGFSYEIRFNMNHYEIITWKNNSAFIGRGDTLELAVGGVKTNMEAIG